MHFSGKRRVVLCRVWEADTSYDIYQVPGKWHKLGTKSSGTHGEAWSMANALVETPPERVGIGMGLVGNKVNTQRLY